METINEQYGVELADLKCSACGCLVCIDSSVGAAYGLCQDCYEHQLEVLWCRVYGLPKGKYYAQCKV